MAEERNNIERTAGASGAAISVSTHRPGRPEARGVDCSRRGLVGRSRLVLTRGGFTLVELSIVLAIIVLLVSVGWGVIYKIIDPASKESAQNQISSAINAARNRAMAMQKIGGVLFFIDPQSNRVGMATVLDTGPQGLDQPFIDSVLSLGGAMPEVFLDLADTEFTLLPSGVTVQVLNNALMINDVPQNDQYVGFNRFMGPGGTLSIPIGGAILFDGRGELVCRQWAMRMRYVSGSNALVPSPLAQLLFYDKSPNDSFFNQLSAADGLRVFFPGADVSTNRPAEVLPRSTMGVAILNREKFQGAVAKFASGGGVGSMVRGDTGAGIQDAVDSDAQFRQGQSSMDAGERNEEQWISSNGRVMVIGRYSGTLTDTRISQ